MHVWVKACVCCFSPLRSCNVIGKSWLVGWELLTVDKFGGKIYMFK